MTSIRKTEERLALQHGTLTSWDKKDCSNFHSAWYETVILTLVII